jgi:A/G-specific adenine glycosylase
VFPQRYEEILALPGIGASTAGAIAVFAFGQSRPILDGNVKRVLARCFGVEGYPGDTGVSKALWDLSARLLPSRDVEAYTQGLMDLGAGVCVRSRPQCARCPLSDVCVAHMTDRIAALPGPRPRRTLPRRRTTMLVLLHDGAVLLEKRPDAGIWGGLWSFPETSDAAASAGECLTRFGVEMDHALRLPTVAHGFTHFKLTIEPLLCRVLRIVPAAAEAPGRAWVPVAEAMAGAIPAPVRVILGRLGSVGLQHFRQA